MSGLDESEPILELRRSTFGRARGARVKGERNPLDIVLMLAAVVSVVVLALASVHVWLASYGFDSDLLAAKHLAARGGCGEANAVGLAPARIGQPGYWPQLDRNGNGMSCEPYDGASVSP